jgi:hypothetical protein
MMDVNEADADFAIGRTEIETTHGTACAMVLYMPDERPSFVHVRLR